MHCQGTPVPFTGTPTACLRRQKLHQLYPSVATDMSVSQNLQSLWLKHHCLYMFLLTHLLTSVPSIFPLCTQGALTVIIHKQEKIENTHKYEFMLQVRLPRNNFFPLWKKLMGFALRCLALHCVSTSVWISILILYQFSQVWNHYIKCNATEEQAHDISLSSGPSGPYFQLV